MQDIERKDMQDINLRRSLLWAVASVASVGRTSSAVHSRFRRFRLWAPPPLRFPLRVLVLFFVGCFFGVYGTHSGSDWSSSALTGSAGLANQRILCCTGRSGNVGCLPENFSKGSVACVVSVRRRLRGVTATSAALLRGSRGRCGGVAWATGRPPLSNTRQVRVDHRWASCGSKLSGEPTQMRKQYANMYTPQSTMLVY